MRKFEDPEGKQRKHEEKICFNIFGWIFAWMLAREENLEELKEGYFEDR